MYKDYKSNVHPNSKYHSLLGIYPVWLGWLTALPDFECKPRVLDDYFIIFVSAGRGIFKCKGKNYPLGKNDAYFLFPGVVHDYKTGPSKPPGALVGGLQRTECRKNAGGYRDNS